MQINMKKLLLLFLVVVSLASCGHRADEIRLDFMCAYSSYDCLTHKMKLEYMTKVHDTNGAYRPDVDELTDTLKAISERIVTESFDSLYIKYGEKMVKKIIYNDKGIILDNKEALHVYFVNAAVTDALNAITMEVNVQYILNPTEEDKMKAIKNAWTD